MNVVPFMAVLLTPRHLDHTVVKYELFCLGVSSNDYVGLKSASIAGVERSPSVLCIT